MNTSLKFYYLTEEKESTGYELYANGGYLGFTPSSWHSDMGIFHMFKHLVQTDNDTKLELYSMQQLIGIETHPATETSLNYLSIGGYSEKIVTNPADIVWVQSYCDLHWEIYVTSL